MKDNYTSKELTILVLSLFSHKSRDHLYIEKLLYMILTNSIYKLNIDFHH